jgi:uncharacterized 2Fe-2S/4Fe-4S cluster protein (DUF4445 family)
MKHFRVVFQPDDKAVSIHQGATLLEAAGQAGIVLSTPCGGKGTCGKCLVQLSPSGQEVCACQHTVQQDLVVTVPAASRFYEHKILTDGSATVALVQPTVVERYRAAGVAGAILGLAIDIGTTTVVAKLIDMADGRCLATEATVNPQTRYGDDVISRIHYGQSEAGLVEMQRVIVDAINDLIDRLCRAAGAEAESIHEACVVGNTTMNHILLRFPVTQLGQAPYRAHSVAAHDVPASELGLNVNPDGIVHTVENIAGFVGSDTTAVALAVEMDRLAEATLAVDIGTNGELVLAVGGRLYAASCAAGPALEGARIKHGSRAAEGAIEAVVIDDGDVALDVIGSAPARSICGSGLIDAVAVLLELGVVDATGRLLNAEEAQDRCSKATMARLLEIDGQGAFCLALDERTGQPAVVLTQKDIREVQLAKGAIGAGIQLLLRKSGIEAGQLDSLLLAGAFGNYIRPRSAVRVGLLPNVPLDRIHFVGNAAACGAEMILVSQERRDRAAALADRIDYVEIAHEQQFSEVFAESMLLEPRANG